jgi:acyl-homoserine lactone acylase PvdQ
MGVSGRGGSSGGWSSAASNSITTSSPSAKTILAGGQSGNPGSPYYMDNVEEWRLGKLRNVYFYKKGAKKYDGLKQIWTCVP